MLNIHICLDHGSGIVGILARAGWYVCVCVFIWGGSGDLGVRGGDGIMGK